MRQDRCRGAVSVSAAAFPCISLFAAAAMKRRMDVESEMDGSARI